MSPLWVRGNPPTEGARREYARLLELIRSHTEAFFLPSVSAPTISDEDYNALHVRKEELEKEFPDLPYSDESYPERQCDHCGNKYRGPAVYCSLYCALNDA